MSPSRQFPVVDPPPTRPRRRWIVAEPIDDRTATRFGCVWGCTSHASARRAFERRVARNLAERGHPGPVALVDRERHILYAWTDAVRDPSLFARYWFGARPARADERPEPDARAVRPAPPAPWVRWPAEGAPPHGVRRRVPRAIARAMDALVREALGGRRAPCARRAVERWLDRSDWDAGDGDSTLALDPSAVDVPTDDDVRDYHGLDDDAAPTDAERAECLAAQVERLYEDADHTAAYTPVAFASGDGVRVVFVAEVRGYSFSGVTRGWHGPFPSAAHARRWAATRGITDPARFARLPYAEQLGQLGPFRPLP